MDIFRRLFAPRSMFVDLPEESLEELRMTSRMEVNDIVRLRLEFLRRTKGGGWMTRDIFLKIPCIDANPLSDRICLLFGFKDVGTTKIAGENKQTDYRYEANACTDVGSIIDSRNQTGGLDSTTFSEESKMDQLSESEFNNQSESTNTETNCGPSDSRSNNSSGIDFRGFLLGISAFNSTGRIEDKLQLAFRLQDFDDDGILSRADMTEYLDRVTRSRDCNSKTPSKIEKGGTRGDTEEVVDQLFQECSSDPRKQKITFSDFQRVVAQSDFQTKLRLPI